MGPAPTTIDLGEPLEILVDEVHACLRYHEAMYPGRRIDRTYFVGGEARFRGLCESVARRLRLTAQVADPLARIARTGKEPAAGVDITRSNPGWAVAVGLANSPTDL